MTTSWALARTCTDAGLLVTDGRIERVRGVTYGTFRSRADGSGRFPEPDEVRRDFAAMAELGLDTVRIYTVPPADVLDAAAAEGLRLIVGLDYDDWRGADGSGRRATAKVVANGLEAVDRAMHRCAGRSEVLAISVGNEVPVDLVRLHGPRRVEGALERLLDAVHDADPGMLATYTNYPSTEFLDPGGQDLVSWNVFLELREAFARYVRHLLVLAGDRPLVLSEFGLAAGIHGEAAQAASLDWQIDELLDSGASGGTVFSWTDEWAVADVPVTSWDFGITRADRSPKLAAAALSRFHPPPESASLPLVSVVICAYNEAANIEACIESVLSSTYPELEVIVCDDGSDDATAELASRYPVRLVRLRRGGLSAARNAGMRLAAGEIVAYLDADAEASPDWVDQLRRRYDDPAVVAVGGPNHPYRDAGLVEHAVAACPGNAREVLIGDDRAEHIAGCNMSFRRDALLDLEGFDVAYRAAGDDVDLCWRILDRGWQIGFAPAAGIRHHRRGSVGGFLRQQRGYGRAERMLQGPHRERFNRLGQARWKGFVYGGLSLPRRLLGSVVYHGPMGLEPFQPIRHRRGEVAFASLVALLPLFALLGLVATACAAVVARSGAAAAAAVVAVLPAIVVAVTALGRSRPPIGVGSPTRYRLLVAALHVAQPFARFWGRLTTRPLPRRQRAAMVWTGDRLAFADEIVRVAERHRWRVHHGGETDVFDLRAHRGTCTATVNVATVWDWSPQWAMRIRPRRSAVGLLSAGVGFVGLVAPGLTIWAVVAALTAVLVDNVWSSRALRARIAAIAARSEVIDLADRPASDATAAASPERARL